MKSDVHEVKYRSYDSGCDARMGFHLLKRSFVGKSDVQTRKDTHDWAYLRELAVEHKRRSVAFVDQLSQQDCVRGCLSGEHLNRPARQSKASR